MAQIWQTLKVFISSTFLDLELARDQVARLFYRIESRILQRQLVIRLYDLRWEEVLRLWEANSGQQQQVLSGSSREISAVAFHPTGHQVASASSDRSITIWELASGKALCRLTCPGSPAGSLAFHPDGNSLGVGLRNGHLLIYDLRRGEVIQNITAHRKDICSVGFSRDGHDIVSCSFDRSLRLWDAESGKCLKKWRGMAYAQNFALAESEYYPLAQGMGASYPPPPGQRCGCILSRSHQWSDDQRGRSRCRICRE